MKTQLSKDYVRGFERACQLIIGTSPKWPTELRRLFNRTTRQMFGKKRNPRCK